MQLVVKLTGIIRLRFCALVCIALSILPQIHAEEKAPLKYEPLRVPNSCMVDAIHLYDLYLQKFPLAKGGWIRVLRWGNEEGDLKISSGHAVAVFTAKDRLWCYDINFGMHPLPVAVERRGDITDVGPRVFINYPQFRPIFARYVDDFVQPIPKKRPEFVFYHANPDIRAATKVAHELALARPVRVVEFDFKENGRAQTSAATAFIFSSRLCLYFPRHGTYMAPRIPADVAPTDLSDLTFISRVVHHLYPEVAAVRWQPGGYWLFPPKEKTAGKS